MTGKNVSVMDTHVTCFVTGLKVMNGSDRCCDSLATPVTQLRQGFCHELQGLKAKHFKLEYTSQVVKGNSQVVANGTFIWANIYKIVLWTICIVVYHIHTLYIIHKLYIYASHTH